MIIIVLSSFSLDIATCQVFKRTWRHCQVTNPKAKLHKDPEPQTPHEKKQDRNAWPLQKLGFHEMFMGFLDSSVGL